MKYINYSVEDFVKDEYFQKWIWNGDPMTDRFWENWLARHPDKQQVIDKSIRILRLMDFDKEEFSDNDFDIMWQNIVERTNYAKREIQSPKLIRKSAQLNILKVAVIFLGLITFVTVLQLLGFFDPTTEVPIVTESKITLELEDGTIKVLDETSSKIVTNATGEIVLKQEQNTLSYYEMESDSKILGYNQLNVPYGKKFHITLSDGSHVYLNSGSRLRYPINFLKHSPRNVYLDGEAYFSVEKDETSPFTVITDEMNTRVLGTEFNVSSYKNENNTSTILVEGRVSVYKSNNQEGIKPLDMEPGQRAVFENNSIEVEKVNVSKFIAWKEGKLHFVDDRFDLILKELERHFDVKIDNQYAEMSSKKYSGTFVEESLDQILRICLEHTPFDYSMNGDKITIQPKKSIIN